MLRFDEQMIKEMFKQEFSPEYLAYLEKRSTSTLDLTELCYMSFTRGVASTLEKQSELLSYKCNRP